MTDILVIGAGPAGLTAALYARRGEKEVTVVEKGAFGGQITYSPRIENYPGFESVSGTELADAMVSQALNQGANLEPDEIISIEKTENGFRAIGEYGTYESKTVIIAAGAKHRQLGVEGENRFTGEGISYCAVCDGAFYKGKTVAVIGGGNSALQEAVLLSEGCKKVILVQNLDHFTGEQKLIDTLKQKNNVEFITGTVVTEFLGETDLTGIRVSGKDGEKVLVVDGMNWHSGVIGIVAARITEKYGKPAIVITFDGDEGTGSARSISGFSVYEAIKSAEDLLTHFGGHTLAAGLGIKRENVGEFFNRVNDYASNLPDAVPELLLDCKLNPAYIDTALVESLENLEPFGAGNPQPIFGIFGVRLDSIKPVGEGKHLRLSFTKGNTQFVAMKFSTTILEFPFCEGDTVDLAVRIDKNEFRGEVKASVQLREIRFSGVDDDTFFKSRALYEKYKRGEALTSHEARFLMPTREFLLGVYNLIKQYNKWPYDVETLTYRAKCPVERYCTMLVSLDVLNELKLIYYENEQIVFDGDGKKADLSQSKILNELNQMKGGE